MVPGKQGCWWGLAGVCADTPRLEGHLTSELWLHLGCLSALLAAAPPSESKDPPLCILVNSRCWN